MSGFKSLQYNNSLARVDCIKGEMAIPVNDTAFVEEIESGSNLGDIESNRVFWERAQTFEVNWKDVSRITERTNLQQ